MKQFTSTLFMLLACMYLSAQQGTPDATFNPSGTPGYTITDIDGQKDFVKAMVVKPSDNSFYVTGYINGTSDDSLFVIHYKNDGTLDPAFGTGGIVKYKYLGGTTRGYAIGLLSTGEVVVAGQSWPSSSNFDFFLGRFDGATGAVNSAVTTAITNSADVAYALAVQSNDHIVVVGTAPGVGGGDMVVARYDNLGALDLSFNGTGFLTQDVNTLNDVAKAVAIDKTTGDIIVAGTTDFGNSNSDFAILRLSSAGVPVTTFDGDGIKTQNITATNQDEANAVAIDGNGNIVVAGTTSTGGNPDIALIRLSAAGVPDAGFNTTGIVISDLAPWHSADGVTGVTIQTDNNIVVGGGTDAGGSTFDPMVARYIGTGVSAGTLDASFGTAGIGTNPVGANTTAAAMQLAGSKIYTAANTNVANSDVVVAVFNNNAFALPIVLSSFYAQKQTNKVVLQWQTSSEENVKQFVIERSTDGKTYKAIGQVAASGNSSLTKHYSFADNSPFMSTSNYYRLNMQDADGAYKYSKTLIIKFDGQLTTSLSVFPNPTKDLLQVQLPDGMTGTVGLQVFDLNGRMVKLINLASDGNALNTTVDVSTFKTGIYILKAQAGNITLTSRFIKK